MAEPNTRAANEARQPGAADRGGIAGILARDDVLAGLMFIAFALMGLFLGRDFEIGTATRMGTGYVPRLICFGLLGLGVMVVVMGLRGHRRVAGASREAVPWRPLIFVPAAVFAFGFTVERVGLVVATFLVIGISALAARGQRPIPVALVAAALSVLVVAIFIFGLELPFSIWPRER